MPAHEMDSTVGLVTCNIGAQRHGARVGAGVGHRCAQKTATYTKLPRTQQAHFSANMLRLPRPPVVVLAVVVVTTIVVVVVVGHSWNYNPTPREYGLRPAEIDNEEIITGCKYTRTEGEEMTYSRGGHLAMRRVSRGRELCVSWAANGHEREPGRGWVRVGLSTDGDTQDKFDGGVLGEGIDFAAFEGVRLLIPNNTTLGPATIQWRWDYCGANREFVTCSDVVIVAENDVSGHGLGLRGNEQQRYLGHCADGMPPLPTTPYMPKNICEKEKVKPEEEEEEEEDYPHLSDSEGEDEDCLCTSPPLNQTQTFHFVCTGVEVN